MRPGNQGAERGTAVERFILYGIGAATILFLIFLWYMLF